MSEGSGLGEGWVGGGKVGSWAGTEKAVDYTDGVERGEGVHTKRPLVAL